MKNEKEKYQYTQSFPRFVDTYRFNTLKRQPEVDGQLDIVQFVQDNYVDSFSKLLNNTIDELENENKPYIHVRDLDDLIEISDRLYDYKETYGIDSNTSFEDLIKILEEKQKNQEKEIENEKKEETQQEVQSQNV